MKADIEECHRGPLSAHDDSLQFFSEHYVTMKLRAQDEEKNVKQFEEAQGFFPFALVCPAGNSTVGAFAFKMIALIIASICEQLDQLDAEWELKPEISLPALGQVLKGGREDYLSLVYQKAEAQLSSRVKWLAKSEVWRMGNRCMLPTIQQQRTQGLALTMRLSTRLSACSR
jgi:hypothetical protein